MDHLLPMLISCPECLFTSGFERFDRILEYSTDSDSPFFWEYDCLIVYVTSGTGTALVNGVPIRISEGSIGVLHFFHVFQFSADPGSVLHMQILCYPYPDMATMQISAAKHTDSMHISPYDSPFTSLDRLSRDKVESLLRCMNTETEHPDYLTPIMRKSICSQLFAIQRRYRETQSEFSLPLSTRIFLYTATRCFGALTADEVSKHFGIRRDTVNQYLRRICFDNFQSVIRHSRLSKAYSMMLRTSLSLVSICRFAGFSGESAFYRAFRDAFGMSPRDYRIILLGKLSGSTKGTDDRIIDIQAYVHENFTSSIDIHTCSNKVYMTEKTIEELLSLRYGKEISFAKYLSMVRLHYSIGLLTMSDMPVSDVAMNSGFNSLSTFIRQFKVFYGIAPAEYRKTHRHE